MQYFQDDIFPDTKVKDQPTMTANGWLNDGNAQQSRVSLRPSNMKPCKLQTWNVLDFFFNLFLRARLEVYTESTIKLVKWCFPIFYRKPFPNAVIGYGILNGTFNIEALIKSP